MARPLKAIDPKQVATLAKIHCTMIEIAAVVGCSVDTLENRFSDVIKSAREQGTSSLRRKQWELALKGDRTMLIWLGKQHLGQSDRQAVDHTSRISADLPMTREQMLQLLASIDRFATIERLLPHGNGDGDAACQH